MTDVAVYIPVESLPLSHAENYELLIQRLLHIRSQRAGNAHMELIRAKYEAGQAIALSPIYEGPGIPGSGKLLRQVGRDLNWSQSEMYSCLKFWHKVGPDLDGYLDEVKSPTWTNIKHQLNSGLPRPKTPKADLVRTVKANRTRAIQYTADKVGKVWTTADQSRLEKLLNWVQTKREVKSPG